jgi:hypothetical protein
MLVLSITFCQVLCPTPASSDTLIPPAELGMLLALGREGIPSQGTAGYLQVTGEHY